jgi:hypothetical protein
VKPRTPIRAHIAAAAVAAMVAACSAAVQKSMVRTLDAISKSAEPNSKVTKNGQVRPKVEKVEGKRTRIWSGQTIEMPAPENGINEAELGVAHDPDDLRPLARVPAKLDPSKATSADLSNCTFDIEFAKDTLEQKLNASYFNIGGDFANDREQRSLRYAANCFTRRLALQRDAEIDESKPALIPIEIKYGWGYQHILYGSQETMTASLKADVLSIGISAAMKKAGTTVQEKHATVGLTPKGDAPVLVKSEADVTRYFTKSKPQAVTVTYLVVGGVRAEKLAIQKFSRLTAGKYKVHIEADLAEKRPGFGSWDPRGNDRPDATLRLHMPSAAADVACQTQDNFRPRCDGIIELRPSKMNAAVLSLIDEQDRVPLYAVNIPHKDLRPNEELSLSTGDSGLTRLTLKFTRVR